MCVCVYTLIKNWFSREIKIGFLMITTLEESDRFQVRAYLLLAPSRQLTSVAKTVDWLHRHVQLRAFRDTYAHQYVICRCAAKLMSLKSTHESSAR